MIVPLVKGLNDKVLSAVSNDDSLEVGCWHACETTHCWAGWIVFLAGEEGELLEDQTSTLFAAMMIFKKSNNGQSINPCNFFLSNEETMEKIKEIAESK